MPNEEYFAGKWIVHLDCFAWVQRDSYLPCGARGLKAVTRYKLKYDPVELDPEASDRDEADGKEANGAETADAAFMQDEPFLLQTREEMKRDAGEFSRRSSRWGHCTDPETCFSCGRLGSLSDVALQITAETLEDIQEAGHDFAEAVLKEVKAMLKRQTGTGQASKGTRKDMTPFAKERPQELAAYSVSDAVATYYLYMKYIHDFIFALCSIIPYGPDDVLRKGSGTLCESLLMNQAAHANVLFPNKHVDPPLEFHELYRRKKCPKKPQGVFVQNAPKGEDSQAQFENTPFAEGGFRYVYRGVYTSGPRQGEECVMKEFKSGCVHEDPWWPWCSDWEDTFFKEDIEAVKKAGDLIEKFNAAGVVSKGVYLNEPEVWSGNAGRITGHKVLVEPMIKGEYFKFNSNTGHAEPDTATMQALSHFTYHQSKHGLRKGQYLLCDLQGGRYDGFYVLTDPVIHSRNKEFGGTDLGADGIENFMAHHRCGRFCSPNWKMPTAKQLIPKFEAVCGTTFGEAAALFSDEERKDLEIKVKKEMRISIRKLWENALPGDKNKNQIVINKSKKATNRLVEQSTYEGARVECMRVGVYRADIKETFKIEPSAVQTLLDHLKGTVDFFLTQEEKVKLEDVENYEEVLAEVENQLRALCDPDKVAEQVGRLTHEHSPLKTQQVEEEQEYQLQLVEYEVIEGTGGIKSGGKKVKKSSYRVVKDDFPLIYHLDVGAMYPNIILSNRLQPMAIVTKEFCNSCTYNDPSNNCQREMDWKWRGDLYMATRADVKAIINEMESEKRRYNSKDKETGEVKRVKWSELHPKEQTEEITKAVRQFSQKAYKRLKSSVYEDKRDIVCQRENPFYVNTVLNFRDRRYMFKRRTKEWNKKLEKAEESLGCQVVPAGGRSLQGKLWVPRVPPPFLQPTLGPTSHDANVVMFSLCFAAPNAWKVLGLSEGASKEEIKAAYRRLASKYHPDVDKSREAPKRFLQVQQAYKALISSRPVRPDRRRPPSTTAPAPVPAPSKQRRSERRTAWRTGSAHEERPLSEILDKFLPSRALAQSGQSTWLENGGDLVAKSEAKDMVLLNDSLQLAHKCILNSFYGYVMRKGARWHSMKMAGIVTYTGANLIREAREFCEQVGLPLELDTDGIWCLLPKSFPDTFKIKMKGGKEIKMPYPNCVLNYRVHQKYTNHQYQDWDNETKSWKTSSQNSILFEIDGPYKAMILPASTEEDKMLKKRYAVYNFDGSLAELKGFEVKRRGELRLIQVFQTEVFPEFLKGNSKEEVWQIVGAMANRWLDVIESKGSTMTNDEVIHFFSENKTMSKSVEAVGSYKCVQATTVRRLSEFLGVPSMLQAEGISAHMLIANKPVGASCTERAIPVKIFFAEEEVKKVWLRQWLQDSSLTDFDMRSIIDWEYYKEGRCFGAQKKERLCAVFQKLISIPAAYQKIANPCPRVKVPEWLRKRVAEQNDRFKQRSLNLWLRAKCEPEEHGMEGAKRKMDDMEDLAGALEAKSFGQGPKKWLEVQRMRWAGQSASKGSWQASLFDANAGWASVPTEVLRGTWHVLAIEASCAARTSLDVKVGDPVLAEIPVDHMDDLGTHHPEEATELLKGTVMSFAGGLVRLMMDSGEEEVVKRSAVRPIQDGGLFTMWFASGPGLAVYRCEVAAKRRVILALESELNPEETLREVRPSDLIKGLKVRGSAGDGVVTSSSKELGLCSVQWQVGGHEAVFCKDLLMQTGNATRVTRDAPRNLRHGCLVEMQMSESDFQQQHNEGRYGEDGWPRVSSVFEAEQPLMFDLMCRLGPVVRLNGSCVPEQRRNGLLRIDAEDGGRWLMSPIWWYFRTLLAKPLPLAVRIWLSSFVAKGRSRRSRKAGTVVGQGFKTSLDSAAASRARCNERVFMHYCRAALGWCCRRRAVSASDPLAAPSATGPESESVGAGPFVSHTWSEDSVSSDDSRSKQASFGSVSLHGSSVLTNRSVQSSESRSDAQSSSTSSKDALIDDDVCGFWKPQWYHGKSASSSGSSSARLPSELTREEGPVRSWIEAHAHAFPPSSAQETPAGSLGHPNQCSPCVFFATRARCNAGQQCAFCHLPHSMTQVRRRLKAADAPEDSGDDSK
eukprot:s249_g2.t4